MLKALLVCYISKKTGIGHLSRLLALAQKLKKDKKIISEFLIFGDLVKKDGLDEFQLHNFSFNRSFKKEIRNILKKDFFNFLIIDLNQDHKIINLTQFFEELKKRNIYIIGIDSLIEHCNILDIIWIPSFNFNFLKYNNCKSLVKSGWDTYLIQKNLKNKKWYPGSKVLVLTGGSDAYILGKSLPKEIDNKLNDNIELHWVKGPLSISPIIPKKQKLKWIIHDAPNRLDELIVQSNYVLTIFGISFFEALQYGIPTVVFSPLKKKDEKDLKALSKQKVAKVANNSKLAVKALSKLIDDNKMASEYSTNAFNKMSVNGIQNLSKKIYSLAKIK